MLIALLLALGVDLIVVVAFAALVGAHKRRVLGRPDAFRGAIRVTSGEVDGLRPAWSRGAGRWVRDVLVWTKAPFLIRNKLLPTDGVDQQRPAGRDEVKLLGDHPLVIRLNMGRATREVAAAGDKRELLVGPYHPSGNARVQ
jgi:hypothetical protein